MKYKIVADSSCDLTEEMKKEMNVEIVPLTLQLGEKEYIDDENLNVREYVSDMNQCKTPPKSACPSPGEFLKNI